MKQVAAIAWKEWRENSPLLWIALGVFLGLPVIGGLQYMVSGLGRHHFEISAEPGVIALGGVFAILVAVGATCRDLNGKLEEFWRSRPVTGMRWMLVKFIVGLAIVMVSLLIPLMATWLTDRSTFANYNLLELMRPLLVVWCLFYCIGFLAGCLLQRPAHATVLALTALLLIYFVPMLLLPGNGYLVSLVPIGRPAPEETNEWGYVIAGVLFLLAMIAAHWRWRIEPGPKFMYGTIAAAFLIFLFSTGYRLGTNLPVLQQIDLMPKEEVETFYMEGAHGYVVTGKYADGWPVGPPGYFRQLDLAADGLQLGPAMPMWYDYLNPKNGKKISLYYTWLTMDGRNRVHHGDVEYIYYADQTLQLMMDVISLKHDTRGERLATILLPMHITKAEQSPDLLPYIWNNRLYLIGSQVMTIDISRPLSPRVISSVARNYGRWSLWLNERTLAYDLPQIPELPDAERLQIAVKEETGGLSVKTQRPVSFVNAAACDGEILCLAQGGRITEFRLVQLTPKRATFKRIGESDDLDEIFSWSQAYAMVLQGDLLYVPKGRGDMNPVVKVYDTNGPGRPRVVGHFAAQSGHMFVHPLPDGRAIIAGSKIWLVGAPPHMKN